MIDISGAQLEPYRAFHFFHENLNKHIKVSIASSVLLVDHAAKSENPRELGRLIGASHPAWNMPPVHEIDLDRQKQMYAGVSSFAVVALFSALDDFIDGIEADLARAEKWIELSRSKVASGGDEDRVVKLYLRYGWATNGIEAYLPALRYFRLIRDCIAHRSFRASDALAVTSSDDRLHVALRPLLERTTKAAPVFMRDDDVFVDPTLAITCSDLLRKIATDCNRAFMSAVGVDGFIALVAHNLMFSEKPVRTDAYKTPEAVLNLALTERYRVPVEDRLIPTSVMKKVGLWKDFIDAFDRGYA